MSYIQHGTLQDFIDYKKLLQLQANTQRVVKSRKYDNKNKVGGEYSTKRKYKLKLLKK